MNYSDFIANKTQLSGKFGFTPTFMPESMFDFQKDLTTWGLEKGRGALFEDCGLGKTVQYLTWAQNVVEHTNNPVLILTPLAVSYQVQSEGQKFGIDCEISRDGKFSKKIVVTNYQRLHYFNCDDFAGCVADECFPPDTPVEVFTLDNSLTLEHIEDVKVGDKILNAQGEDYVQEISKKRIDRAVRIGTGGYNFTCSENHPWFTLHGWKRAEDLLPGDCIMATREAVRLVRDGVCSKICSLEDAEVLRKILLGEMADEYEGTQGQSPRQGSDSEKSRVHEDMVEGRKRICGKTTEEDVGIKSVFRSGSKGQTFSDLEGYEVEASNPGWKREAYPNSSTNFERSPKGELDFRISSQDRNEDNRIPDLLQGGSGQPGFKNSDRGGWSEPSITTITGSKERYDVGFSRVDSVEILEQGHPELEKYRNADGYVYFHDIKATRHPSFSVMGHLVHNSGCIKHFKGVLQRQVTQFMRKIKYRLLCTATAAPNDYPELGTSSEALGEMGYMDMLAKYFRQNQGIPDISQRWAGGVQQYRFKRHAEKDFWRWVASWARAIRKPSDIGFEDNGFILPPLIETQYEIKTTRPLNGKLFIEEAVGMREEKQELAATVKERCEKAAELCNHDRQSVVWCHFNYEGDLLEKLIPDAVQVSGSNTDDEKESRLMDFAKGNIQRLVTKSKIAQFGMNFQSCSHTVFFPSHSWESYYQSIRRFWRFGQKNQVNVDIVTTPALTRVMKNLQNKAVKADIMFSEITKYMNEIQGDNPIESGQDIILPKFI